MSEKVDNGPEVISIRWAEFDRMCATKGWNTEQERAAGVGISYQMLRHLRTKHARPGANTIDRVLATFGAEFYPVLFERIAKSAA